MVCQRRVSASIIPPQVQHESKFENEFNTSSKRCLKTKFHIISPCSHENSITEHVKSIIHKVSVKLTNQLWKCQWEKIHCFALCKWLPANLILKWNPLFKMIMVQYFLYYHTENYFCWYSIKIWQFDSVRMKWRKQKLSQNT